MKTLPEPMEFPTFVSLLSALEENYALLRMADDSAKDRSRCMKRNIQIMEEIIRKLDESAQYPVRDFIRYELKAA